MLKRLIKGVCNRYRRYTTYYKYKDILAKNSKLLNTKSGKRCFIMGTGPSIKDQDILKLKNEETFVVNEFWNYPKYRELNPKYYVFMDYVAFIKDKDSYWKDQFMSNVKTLNSLPTQFFFHINAKEMVESDKLFPIEKVNYLANDGFFREDLDFNIDISRIIPNTKNVIISSILIAINMGFEEIYLLGCEHSFLAYPSNYEWSPHFYKNDNFDINNQKDVERYTLTITTYEQIINHASKLFQNYRILRTKLAKERPSIKIYNATPNSFLDVFPKIKFEDIKL